MPDDRERGTTDDTGMTGAQSFAFAFGVVGVLACFVAAFLGINYLQILAAGCR